MKNIFKKIIKIIVIICVLGYSLLWLSFYAIPWINTNLGCRLYIMKNYPNAKIKNIEYEQQVAFIFFGGKTEALVDENGYEFVVEANNIFISKADITDYYGSSPYQFYRVEYDNSQHNDNELFGKVLKYISNHEIFKKYQFHESQTSILLTDEPRFITKEKADKNTFEIISIDITIDFLTNEVDCINRVTSDEKHILIEDVEKFLKNEKFKFHQLELAFNFDSKDKESYYSPDVRESISIYSDEFLKYKNEEYNREQNIEISELDNIINDIKNIELSGWYIKGNPIVKSRGELHFIIKNKDDREILKENIKDFFININELLVDDYSRTCIKLILEDKSHKENTLHTLEYNR